MKFKHTSDGIVQAHKFLSDNGLMSKYNVLHDINKFYSIVGFANEQYQRLEVKNERTKRIRRNKQKSS